MAADVLQVRATVCVVGTRCYRSGGSPEGLAAIQVLLVLLEDLCGRGEGRGQGEERGGERIGWGGRGEESWDRHVYLASVHIQSLFSNCLKHGRK